MLPLVLVNAARGKGLLVELKSGETFNGLLIACDNFMNLTLREVYQTSSSGEEFWKLPECYIKGATIKYVRLADSTIDTVRQQEEQERRARQGGGGGGGGGGQRGGHGSGDRGGSRGGRGGGPGGRGGGPQRGGRGGGGGGRGR